MMSVVVTSKIEESSQKRGPSKSDKRACSFQALVELRYRSSVIWKVLKAGGPCIGAVCLRNPAESAHLAPWVGYIVALELLRSFIWKLSKHHLKSLFLAQLNRILWKWGLQPANQNPIMLYTILYWRYVAVKFQVLLQRRENLLFHLILELFFCQWCVYRVETRYTSQDTVLIVRARVHLIGQASCCQRVGEFWWLDCRLDPWALEAGYILIHTIFLSASFFRFPNTSRYQSSKRTIPSENKHGIDAFNQGLGRFWDIEVKSIFRVPKLRRIKGPSKSTVESNERRNKISSLLQKSVNQSVVCSCITEEANFNPSRDRCSWRNDLSHRTWARDTVSMFLKSISLWWYSIDLIRCCRPFSLAMNPSQPRDDGGSIIVAHRSEMTS